MHLASIGNPVAGDQIYGPKKQSSLFPRQMLHSFELKFIHPISQRELKLTAPLTEDFQNVLSILEQHGDVV